jgi:hypothetical protein
MALTPRRTSSLAGDPFEPADPSQPPQPPQDDPKTTPEPPQDIVEPAEIASIEPTPAKKPAAPKKAQQRRAQRTPDLPVTRNPRRLRVVGKVDDSDLVSFNCKMSRGLRRQVRHFAADAECDIQDVVAAALEEYLTARGIDVPVSDLQQPG